MLQKNVFFIMVLALWVARTIRFTMILAPWVATASVFTGILALWVAKAILRNHENEEHKEMLLKVQF